MSAYDPQHEQRLEHATRQRLAKLSAVPVDASRLEDRLRQTLSGAATPPRRLRWPTWGGMAAALALAAGLWLTTLSTPSHATAHMIELHQAMVSGQVELVAAQEADARQMIDAGWNDRADLPRLPAHLIRSCCLRAIDGQPALGMLLHHEDVPVSLVMTPVEGLGEMPGEPVVRGGRRYFLHHMHGTSMVMTRLGDRALCFMGDMPADDLLALAHDVIDR